MNWDEVEAVLSVSQVLSRCVGKVSEPERMAVGESSFDGGHQSFPDFQDSPLMQQLIMESVREWADGSLILMAIKLC